MTRLRNTFLIAAAVLATLLCTVASASARPEPNTDNGFAPATTPVAPHVASSGMAAWTVALIALSSAALAVLATELWHAYRGHRDIAHRTATV